MALDDVLEKAVTDGVMPGGVVVAIDKRGTTLINKAFGKRSAAPNATESMTLDTVFSIKSMTKLLTSICVLQLVERGQLTVDEDILHHLPVLARQKVLRGFNPIDDSPILEDRKGPINLRQLLTHSSGAGIDFVQPELRRYRQVVSGDVSPSGYIDERCDLPLLFQPGEGWAYGAGVTWAGKVAESVAGVNLEEYMRENVFKPLGIEGITFFPEAHPELQGRLASMTIVDKETGKVVDITGHGLPDLSGVDVKDCFGGEGAYADLTDFSEVVKSLLMNDGKLLQRETVDQLFEPRLPTATSKAALRDAFADTNWLPGDFEGPNEYDWSLGGLLIEGDGHEFRRKGCLLWIGAAHTFWFIDPAAGVCGVFGTQVFPPADPKLEEAIREFQREAYRSAGRGNE